MWTRMRLVLVFIALAICGACSLLTDTEDKTISRFVAGRNCNGKAAESVKSIVHLFGDLVVDADDVRNHYYPRDHAANLKGQMIECMRIVNKNCSALREITWKDFGLSPDEVDQAILRYERNWDEAYAPKRHSAQ